jgi:hypothetical protein
LLQDCQSILLYRARLFTDDAATGRRHCCSHATGLSRREELPFDFSSIAACGEINGRDQAVSFAGNESKKRMANSDSTSYV